MHKPEILYEGKYSKKSLDIFKKNRNIWKTIDVYKEQLTELFKINNPELLFSEGFKVSEQKYVNIQLGKEPYLKGNWVYFPWSGLLAHIVNQNDYFSLRTNRNRNLITNEEQKKLYDFCVSIVGLSIGNSIALTLAYQGFGTFRLAELDKVETTNLNRLRGGIGILGKRKIEVVSEQIFEIDPYAKLILFEKGLLDKNINKFFGTYPRPKVVVDECDDLKMKVKLRITARRNKIPVIMLTNLGDSIMADIERYDKNQNLKLFNGLIGDSPERILEKEITKEDIQKVSVEIVGIQNIPERAMLSVREIGKTLVGRPQLSATVSVSAGVAAYLVRKLALGDELPSGRIIFKFDSIFELSKK